MARALPFFVYLNLIPRQTEEFAFPHAGMEEGREDDRSQPVLTGLKDMLCFSLDVLTTNGPTTRCIAVGVAEKRAVVVL